MAEVETEIFRATGALFDPHDHRDRPLYSQEQISIILSSPDARISDKLVLPNLPPVYDQGGIGSCVANSCCAALRYACVKHTRKEYSDHNPSRLFAYYFGRTIRATTDVDLHGLSQFDPGAIEKDTGTFNRAVLKAFNSRGVCKEELWPYGHPSRDEKTKRFLNTTVPPSPKDPEDWDAVQCQADSGVHNIDIVKPPTLFVEEMIPKAIHYFRVYKPTDTDPTTNQQTHARDQEVTPPIKVLERALEDGIPFIFSSCTFKDAGFQPKQMTKGVYLKPPLNTKLLERDGAHSLLAIGYDPTEKAFLIQNSWGECYNDVVEGSRGRFWMPYEWFKLKIENKDVVSDFWVITSVDSK